MPDSAPPQHVNAFFRLLVPAVGLFVVTMFAFIATLFSDPTAEKSPVQRFLDQNIVLLFTVETAAIVAFGFAAMILDRRQTVRHQPQAARPSPDHGEHEPASPPND